MIDGVDLEDLRHVRRISYYFRYPLHRHDFHELNASGRLRGHYAAKPLYGRLTSAGRVDRSAGYNGDIAALFVPIDARDAYTARLVLTHIAPDRIVLPSGERNWPAIRAASERAIRETLERSMKGAVTAVARKFELGDHVSWNSEAGRVLGKIIRVHMRDFDYNGHTRHASPEDPQYEVKSDKTDHIAAHKGSALARA